MVIVNQHIVRPAGFWIRLAANLLDGIVVSVPLTFVSYLMTGSWEDNLFRSLISLLYGLIVPVIWSGYTVGKRIVGIRIVKVNGNQVGIGTMLMRTVVASLIYIVTFGVAIIVSAFMVGLREDKRSIHDFIAGTYVTYETP